MGDIILSAWTVTLGVIGKPGNFPQQQGYITIHGPHARYGCFISQTPILNGNAGRIGCIIDGRTALRGMFTQAGIHPRLHGRILNHDDAAKGNAALDEQPQEEGNIVAAVGGFALQGIRRKAIAPPKIAGKKVGLREASRLHARAGAADFIPQRLGCVAFSADDYAPLGYPLAHARGKQVTAG